MISSDVGALRQADRSGSDQPLTDMDFDADYIAALREPDATGTRGIHPVRIAACGKHIRKIRDRLYNEFGLRIEDQKLLPAHPTTATQNTQEIFCKVRIVDNITKNRVQIFFPHRPDRPTRKTLQCWGYRWSAAVEAYQRLHSPEALHTARRICSVYR